MKQYSMKHRYSRASRRGFTLIEIMVAASMMGFSLVVMIALHSQAVRSNMHAKRMTDCTYLAQAKMELLHSLPWTSSSTPTSLTDLSGADPTTASDPFINLEHPTGGPNARSAGNNAQQGYAYGPRAYYISWDIENMDSDRTWVRIRVRCKYRDRAFSRWKGTTISSYRFRDS